MRIGLKKKKVVGHSQLLKFPLNCVFLIYRGNDSKQSNVVIVSIFNGANFTLLQTYFSIGDSSTSPSAVM